MNSGTFSIGDEYMIENYQSGDDFSNIATNVHGASMNSSGCVFTATGEVPSTWSNGTSVRHRTSSYFITPVASDLPSTTLTEQDSVLTVDNNGYVNKLSLSDIYASNEYLEGIIIEVLRITYMDLNLSSEFLFNIPDDYYPIQIFSETIKDFNPTDPITSIQATSISYGGLTFTGIQNSTGSKKFSFFNQYSSSTEMTTGAVGYLNFQFNTTNSFDSTDGELSIKLLLKKFPI